jgi:uncharacterized protein
MIQRSELQILRSRLKEPKMLIQVVMGPRQVGKTTVVTQLCRNIDIPFLFESADARASSDNIWLEQIWETARMKLKTSGANQFLLIIDEIQKITNWSETIKRLWDEDTFNAIVIKVILLGSSRLLLQKGLTESLAGRFEIVYMGHWSYQEMHDCFGWDEENFVWFGSYPGGVPFIKDEIRWKRYIRDSLIETTLSKDILMLTRIDKPALLKSLFELGCEYSGQILSFNKILGQLQNVGNTTTLSHYLSLLDTAGLLSGLEKYDRQNLRQRASSPKFQVYNNALISSLTSVTYSDAINQPVLWGRFVESAIGSHLINSSWKGNYSLQYWRDRNDEVDFILMKDNKIIALEIKSNVAKNQKGMDAFKKKFNPDKVYIIDNRTISWKEFLKIDPESLF